GDEVLRAAAVVAEVGDRPLLDAGRLGAGGGGDDVDAGLLAGVVLAHAAGQQGDDDERDEDEGEADGHGPGYDATPPCLTPPPPSRSSFPPRTRPARSCTCSIGCTSC